MNKYKQKIRRICDDEIKRQSNINVVTSNQKMCENYRCIQLTEFP